MTHDALLALKAVVDYASNSTDPCVVAMANRAKQAGDFICMQLQQGCVLSDEVAAKSKRIDKLERELETQVKNLSDITQAKNKTIEEQRRELSSMRRHVQTQSDELSNQRQKINELQRQVNELRANKDSNNTKTARICLKQPWYNVGDAIWYQSVKGLIPGVVVGVVTKNALERFYKLSLMDGTERQTIDRLYERHV